MPSAGAELWISLETHQCYKWSVAGSRLKESNFLKIAWAESWGHGEVLLFSKVFLLWSSLYLWEIGSYIIFDVKPNWMLCPATHPCLRQKMCPGNVDNLAKLGHWAAFLAGRKVRPATRDGCGWNPYMPPLLWQCLGGSVTKTWPKGPSVGLVGQTGDRCLCCVTQLDMSTPSMWGYYFPILVYFCFLFFGFFSPSSLSNHQSSLLPAICLGSSPSHSERVRHSLNLDLSKSLLGFLISTKPLSSCISSKECQTTAQSIIWKPGCL